MGYYAKISAVSLSVGDLSPGHGWLEIGGDGIETSSYGFHPKSISHALDNDTGEVKKNESANYPEPEATELRKLTKEQYDRLKFNLECDYYCTDLSILVCSILQALS